MSEIVKKVEERKLAHVVKVGENYYYVDSALTSLGYETMVFKWNNERNNVVSWTELYCERYFDKEKMEAKHNEIINKLEEFLDPDYVAETFSYADYLAETIFQSGRKD